MKFKFFRFLRCNLAQILLHDLGTIRVQFCSFEFGKGEKEQIGVILPLKVGYFFKTFLYLLILNKYIDTV